MLHFSFEFQKKTFYTLSIVLCGADKNVLESVDLSASNGGSSVGIVSDVCGRLVCQCVLLPLGRLYFRGPRTANFTLK